MNSLIIEIEKTMIDESIIENIATKTNTTARKDGSVCRFYIIPTNYQFNSILTEHHQKMNILLMTSLQNGFQFLVITKTENNVEKNITEESPNTEETNTTTESTDGNSVLSSD